MGEYVVNNIWIKSEHEVVSTITINKIQYYKHDHNKEASHVTNWNQKVHKHPCNKYLNQT